MFSSRQRSLSSWLSRTFLRTIALVEPPCFLMTKGASGSGNMSSCLWILAKAFHVYPASPAMVGSGRYSEGNSWHSLCLIVSTFAFYKDVKEAGVTKASARASSRPIARLVLQWGYYISRCPNLASSSSGMEKPILCQSSRTVSDSTPPSYTRVNSERNHKKADEPPEGGICQMTCLPLGQLD